MHLKYMLFTVLLSLIVALIAFPQTSQSSESSVDPWQKLQEALPPEEIQTDEKAEYDPWKELRRVYLPFTEEEEIEAVENIQNAKPFSKKLFREDIINTNLLSCYQFERKICYEKIGVIKCSGVFIDGWLCINSNEIRYRESSQL